MSVYRSVTPEEALTFAFALIEPLLAHQVKAPEPDLGQRMLVYVMQGHTPRWQRLPISLLHQYDYGDYVKARNASVSREDRHVELIDHSPEDEWNSTMVEAFAPFAY